jgi:hypothetical protein
MVVPKECKEKLKEMVEEHAVLKKAEKKTEKAVKKAVEALKAEHVAEAKHIAEEEKGVKRRGRKVAEVEKKEVVAPVRKARLVKGSEEAKEYMARIRAMKRK